jgi:hypothetical protein
VKKAVVCVAVLALSLLAAGIALAEASFPDPAGDSGGAPDLFQLNVANDAAGNLTFTVTTNQPALAADALLLIAFDTDKNASTGGQGSEFLLGIDSTGWELDRWDGAQFVQATAPSANATYTNGALTFKVNKSDLGGVSTFAFYALSAQFSATGEVLAADVVPNAPPADYTLSVPAPPPPPPPPPLTLRASAPVSVPLRPVHGKAFAVRIAVTRGDTGRPLASGVVTCTVRVGLKPLRAVGSVRAGKAGCAMVIPRTATGKRLRGTIKVTFRNVSVTKSFSYVIR